MLGHLCWRCMKHAWKVTNIKSAWSRTAPHFGIIFLGGTAERCSLTAGDLRNPEWMWLHFFRPRTSALWWPVMFDPVTPNGTASCYDTSATHRRAGSIGEANREIIGCFDTRWGIAPVNNLNNGFKSFNEIPAAILKCQRLLQAMAVAGAVATAWLFCIRCLSIMTTPCGRHPIPNLSVLWSKKCISFPRHFNSWMQNLFLDGKIYSTS